VSQSIEISRNFIKTGGLVNILNCLKASPLPNKLVIETFS